MLLLHECIYIALWDESVELLNEVHVGDMGQFPRKLRFAICYKIYLRLNHYNFRTVKGINVLFSILNTTSFLYGKIYLRVLDLLRASIASFDTPPGSNPP